LKITSIELSKDRKTQIILSLAGTNYSQSFFAMALKGFPKTWASSS